MRIKKILLASFVGALAGASLVYFFSAPVWAGIALSIILAELEYKINGHECNC